MKLNRALAVRGLMIVLIAAGVASVVLLRRSPTSRPPVAATQTRPPSINQSRGLQEAGLATTSVKTPPVKTSRLFLTPDRRWNNPIREEAFARFHDWVEQYLRAPTPEAKAALEAEGITLGLQRRHALAALIQSDPERALELVVPVGVRRALPSSITDLLEARVSERGSLAVLGVLAEPGKESEVIPVIRTATMGENEYKAFVYGRRLGEPTRNDIPLNGIAVGDLFAVSENPVRVLELAEAEALQARADEAICGISSQPAAVINEPTPVDVAGQIVFLCRPDHVETLNDKLTAAEGGAPTGGTTSGDPQASVWTEGLKKVIIIRVDFPDLTGVSLTEAGGATLITNLHNFYNEMSYGRAGFTMVGNGSDVTPVFRMPQPGAYYGTNDFYNQLRTDARNAAIAAGYTMANYDRDVICFGAVSGWSWSGLGYVGAAGSWLRNSFGTGVAAHELGHNWGLNHANYWDTAGASVIGTGTSVEYGDSFDTMGSASAGNNHFGASYKSYLNWLTPGEWAAASSNGTYRIACHDNQNSTGWRGLRVVKNASTNYWVEFRQKFTGNKWLMSGASLRWAQNGNQKSQLLDTTPGTTDGKNDSALVIGRTFSDMSSGIHITPIGKGGTTPESLDVVVNLGSFPGNVAPALAMTASATNAATGVTLGFTATATDANGDALAYYWDFGDGNFGTNGPSASKSWSTAGDYVVRCVASDMKGGVASRWMIVRIGSPTTYRITGNISDGANPVHSARIYVSTTRMGYSDSDGNYAIVGLPAGSYTVNASLDGYAFAANGFVNPVSVGPDKPSINFLGTPTSTTAPSITTQPLSQTVNPGASVTFSVVAGGSTPMSYQWRFNGANISGATGSSYTKSNAQATNAGNYSVVVSNAFGTATSANAVLTVNTPPIITAQPQSQTVIVGDSATFSVTASGSTPLAYQWRLNGTNISAATSNGYTRANSQPAHAGNLTVVITNALGAITSAPAALTVNCLLVSTATSGGTVTRSPNQTNYAPGTLVTLTASHPTYAFIGWSGSVSGTTNPLAVTMTTNLNITAIFQSPVPDLIVDNPQAAFPGSWSMGSSAPDKFNSDYRTTTSVGGSATATATFSPTIVAGGHYDVFVWTPTITRGAMATPVQISGNGTNINLSVNQSSGSGGWQLLAAGIPFSPGTNGFVRISNNAGQGGNRDVVADAVRWVYSATQPVPLLLASLGVANGMATVSWNSISGRTYRVEYKTDLNSTVWTPLTPNVTATGAMASKSDPVVAGQRLYRVFLY